MSTDPRPVRRLIAAGTLALVLTGLIAGCGGSSEQPEETGTEIGDPVTVTASSTTTPATAPTATTTVPPVGAATPADASAALYAAFQAGDRVAAAQVAEPAAIEVVFSAVPGPYQPYRGCDTGEFGTSGCLYRDRSTNHTIQFDLERRGTAWVVTNGFYSQD